MTASDFVPLISGWALGLLTMYFPLRQQRKQAQRAEDRANREAAASFLASVAGSLRCIERELSERKPPHECGHKFELLLRDYYEQTLGPYLNDQARKDLRELKELANQARLIDGQIYQALREMGLTESEAASGAHEGIHDPAKDPVQEKWLIRMRQVAGELEGQAAGLASRPQV